MTKEKSPTDKAKSNIERADVFILHPVTFYRCVLQKSSIV